MLVGQLKDILSAYKLDGSDTQRIDAIGTTFVAEVDELMAECDEHLAYAGRNYLPFLLQPYKGVRAQLLNSIEIVSRMRPPLPRRLTIRDQVEGGEEAAAANRSRC